jgi:4-amino-4-deoxy-L-arabinose transferase-like glycosyltransferase
MKLRQAEGGRIDPDNPYPKDPTDWIPATLHPAGYACLMYMLYRMGNYDGMIVMAHVLQAGLDALVCLLIFLFARNIFGRRAGILAAVIYAFLPPAIFLTLPLLPDAYMRFFMALVLCLASFAGPRRWWILLVTGAAIGLACQFRPQFLLLPPVLFLALWAWRRQFWTTVAWTAGMVLVELAVMVPWVLWTKSATGTALLTTTAAGGGMYESLGEIPDNPWGIVLHDSWVEQDARKRGFSSAWSVKANTFYRRRFLECVAEKPGLYARLVFLHRLPVALAPPYVLRPKPKPGEFSFSGVRIREGLTKWGVVRKYPIQVLKHLWREIIMLVISGMLTLSLLMTIVFGWARWSRAVWLLLPWAYTVSTICMIKVVDPRNISAVLIVQTVAMAVMLIRFRDRRQEKVVQER